MVVNEVGVEFNDNEILDAKMAPVYSNRVTQKISSYLVYFCRMQATDYTCNYFTKCSGLACRLYIVLTSLIFKSLFSA